MLAQHAPVELLVVNSGGGDAPGLLAAAGLGDVRVVEHPERLFPGGACNLGLRETTAPYVAFVAGDLVLRPGWVAGRLLRHRAGRAAVAAALVPIEPAGAAGRSSYLLLNHRRTPWTPPGEALRFSLSYDRRLFERYGVFREDLRVGEDLDMQQRFGPEVDIEFAPDVQAAHHGPDGVPAMLRDQFVRGRRMAYTRAWTEGADWRGRIARNALRNARLRGARRARRRRLAAPARAGRQRPRRCSCPVPPAYAAGALTAPLTGARRRRRTRRLIALVPFKDELPYLPGLFENLAPHVDGIVALDDGSTDGSAEYVAGRPEVLELLPGAAAARGTSPRNRERLIRAAWEHGADWLVRDRRRRARRAPLPRPRRARPRPRRRPRRETRSTCACASCGARPTGCASTACGARSARRACSARGATTTSTGARSTATGRRATTARTTASRSPTCSSTTCGWSTRPTARRAAPATRRSTPRRAGSRSATPTSRRSEHLVTAPLPYGRDFTPLRDR